MVGIFPRVFLCGLAAVLISLSTHAFAQAESDPWLIRTNGDKSPINVHTTRQDLVRLYGASNVVDQDVDVGEGEMQSATFLFPNDPERRIEILWKDPNAKTSPESADISGKKSRWHAIHGITVGTSAAELEQLNGRPFHFALTNNGTDMARETISWRGGQLQKEFQGRGRIILEIQDSPSKSARPRSPADFEVDSDNPTWRAQSPQITRMSWFFPPDEQP
jgi:hypothetical protein